MKILDIPRSGSYAGVTSSHNRAGQYIRNRRTPTNAPTARRTFIRSAFGSQAAGYAALTSVQQAAWISAAASHPVTDSLGQSITLTGQQLFVSVNTALLNASAATVTAPPSTFAVFSVAGSSLSFSLATGLDVTLTTTGAAGDFILIAPSRPMSAGRNFNKTFTQMDVEAGNAASASITTADYSAQFGAPVVGQKVFVRVTPVSSKGVTGVPLVLSALVTV